MITCELTSDYRAWFCSTCREVFGSQLDAHRCHTARVACGHDGCRKQRGHAGSCEPAGGVGKRGGMR